MMKAKCIIARFPCGCLAFTQDEPIGTEQLLMNARAVSGWIKSGLTVEVVDSVPAGEPYCNHGSWEWWYSDPPHGEPPHSPTAPNCRQVADSTRDDDGQTTVVTGVTE